MKNDEYWEGIDMQGKTFIQEKVNKIDSYKTIAVHIGGVLCILILFSIQ